MPAAPRSAPRAIKGKPYLCPATSAKQSEPAKPDSTLSFPVDVVSRSRFKLANGKAVTAHQWKVYDYIRGIPAGQVTTYAAISKALESSPRAVGGALRENPFAPAIPCHRIIASTLSIGGYQGAWAKQDSEAAQGKGESEKLSKKLRLLREEGVEFNEKGLLLGGEDKVWLGA